MVIATGLEQTIARVRADNARQIHGVSQHAGSDIARLLEAAEEAADLRQQLAEANAALGGLRVALNGYHDSDLVSLATTLRSTADKATEYHEAMTTAHEEAADLRRQSAECRAQLADSIRVVERRRPDILIAADDFDYQPSE